MGADKKQAGPTVYELLIGTAEPEQAIRRTSFSRLDLLPSSIALAGAEIEMVELARREGRLKPPSPLCGTDMTISLWTARPRSGCSPSTPYVRPTPFGPHPVRVLCAGGPLS